MLDRAQKAEERAVLLDSKLNDVEGKLLELLVQS